MQDQFTGPVEIFSAGATLMAKSIETFPKFAQAAFSQTRATQDYWNGLFKYVSAFMAPSVNALTAFMNTEKDKLQEECPTETLNGYAQLFNFSLGIANTSLTGSLRAMNNFYYTKLGEGISAWIGALKDDESLSNFAGRLEETLRVVVHEYPKAIEAIGPEFGFHLDNGGYVKVAETERFYLYQVLPQKEEAPPRHKPILIVPPYVLGPNILAFLPEEHRSYVHCYANLGIPTYIRLVKDIQTTPAVQTMTGEDDALDTRFFCRELMKKHNEQVTLNGFCQGGYLTLTALLSGELDGLVDAHITCVTPVDGTRSKSLIEYMDGLPSRFKDPRYSYKKLPNGNTVVDGHLLAWVFKLRKLETESPIAAFHRDIGMIEPPPGQRARISKTAAAINHWMTYDQQDLPVGIAEMSYASYTVPIDSEGTLPVTLFGRKLNLKRLEEKKIPWLICIAADDDLVDREASLAALDYIHAEVSIFPKGHASLATSWSVPSSVCAPHLRYHLPNRHPSEGDQTYRGPVCFQIDLDAIGESVGSCTQISGKGNAEQKAPLLLAPIPDQARLDVNPIEGITATPEANDADTRGTLRGRPRFRSRGTKRKKSRGNLNKVLFRPGIIQKRQKALPGADHPGKPRWIKKLRQNSAKRCRPNQTFPRAGVQASAGVFFFTMPSDGSSEPDGPLFERPA